MVARPPDDYGGSYDGNGRHQNGMKAAFLMLSRAQVLGFTLVGIAAIGGSWAVSMYRIGALEDAVKDSLKEQRSLSDRMIRVEMFIHGMPGGKNAVGPVAGG